jgi:CheY-like chemotaxis protein
VVDIVGNGKLALEHLQKSLNLPIMIFMDVNMPVMNGIECMEEIAKDPAIRNIPIIFLSSDVSQRDRVHELGAITFIKKPNRFETLRQELEKLLGQTAV